jgi:hypothetical protein
MAFGFGEYITIISTDQKLACFITFKHLLIYIKMTHSTAIILCYSSNSIPQYKAGDIGINKFNMCVYFESVTSVSPSRQL